MSSSLSLALRENIRAERARHQWNQLRFAEELGGFSRSQVSDLENGKTQLTVGHLIPLCKALGVTFPELLRGCDPADREALGL